MYLKLSFVCFAGQDAEVSRSCDRHQALDVFNKLLVVFGFPEDHAVLLPLWLGVGIHHRAAAVPPLSAHMDRLLKLTQTLRKYEKPSNNSS